MNDPADTDCIFCRIVRGELGTEFVAESEYNVAFRDLPPQAPVHVLIVPRQHFAALRDVGSDDWHARPTRYLWQRASPPNTGCMTVATGSSPMTGLTPGRRCRIFIFICSAGESSRQHSGERDPHAWSRKSGSL